MYTTPKKVAKFRGHPYKTPSRNSPGGNLPPTSPPFPSSPFSSPFAKNSSPRKLNLANLSPKTPHRVGIRFVRSQTPQRSPHIGPGRFSSLPIHLVPDPPLSAIIEESAMVVETSRAPLTEEDAIYWKELARLGAVAGFSNALADARDMATRGVKDGASVNAGIDARTEFSSPTKPRIAEKKTPKRAGRSTYGCRTESEIEEKQQAALQKLADKKRRQYERERLAEAASAASDATEVPAREATPPVRIPSPVPPPSEPIVVDNESAGPSHDHVAANAQRLADEAEKIRLDAQRRAEEHAAYMRNVEAQREAARLEALRAQEERRRAEEEHKLAEEQRILAGIQRAQAEKMKKSAEAKLAQAAREFAIAEEARRQADEERRRSQEARLRAIREEQERLQAQQGAARRLAEQRAKEDAERFAALRAEEARIQADREAFETQMAELRRVAEQTQLTYFERLARVAELERMETVFKEQIRVRLEQLAYFANHPRNPLSEFYRQQAAQRAQEEEFQRQQRQRQEQERQEQERQEQQHQHAHQQYQQQQYQQHQDDVPMRDRSFRDASMHSVHDDTPYADDYQEPPQRSATPTPPPPPTIAQLFEIWDSKWKAIAAGHDLSTVSFEQLPWPVLCDVRGVEDITATRVLEFMTHADRPLGLTHKKVILRYHSDRFTSRVKSKLHFSQQEIAAQLAKHCTILLLNAKNTN